MKKGGIKCFGLLSVCSIMLGLSLSVCSDVNATTFSIDSFLSYPFEFVTGQYGSSSGLGINYTFVSSDVVPNNIRTQSYLVSTYDSSNNKCVYSTVIQPGYIISGTSIDWTGSFVPPFADVSDSTRCRTMKPFGEDGVPNFDESSVPFDKKITVSSFLPYSYMYNTIPLTYVRTVDGVDYPSSFDISEQINNPADPGDPDYIYYSDVLNSVRFPLNWNNSDYLVSGSHLEFSGHIHFSSGLSSSELDNLAMSFYGSKFYFGGDESAFVDSPRCHLTSQNEQNTLVNFYCSGVINNVSYSYIDLAMRLYTLDQSGFSSTKQAISFSAFHLVTNDEWTQEVVPGSISSNGSFPNVAPGVAQVDVKNADFFTSLSNMFNFGFFNPFQPLFNLFADDNTCANIPTISSMLHSRDTQVCHFFDSNTRRILTPVFAFSSMMLIFGFAVRWLGSSSGNFFEDSDVHETKHFSLSSRGVIKS